MSLTVRLSNNCIGTMHNVIYGGSQVPCENCDFFFILATFLATFLATSSATFLTTFLATFLATFLETFLETLLATFSVVMRAQVTSR